MLSGAWALISIAEQQVGVGWGWWWLGRVLGQPHWERPGDSQPFEVVMSPDSWEGRQIEMSFDNGRQPLLSSD